MPAPYSNYWLHRLFLNKVTSSPHPTHPNKTIWDIRLFDTHLRIVDYANSKVAPLVFKELNKRELDFSQLALPTPATIIDIGGQVGMVAIFMAKLFPQSQIHVFEAFDKNFENLLENIELNKVRNITPRNIAVTGDGRRFRMICHENGNTGGSTGWTRRVDTDEVNYSVDSTTLNQILDELGQCDLLKIDCEGAEFEILQNCDKLDSIGNLLGEFHQNAYLASKGYNMDTLESKVRQAIAGHVQIRKMTMCE